MGSCIIGLTGGIASGKSTIRELLGKKGIAVLDADKLGHQCYVPGSMCFQEVVAVFGSSIVTADGKLDRSALGTLVFGNKNQLKRLNGIVWPYIKREMEQAIGLHRATSGGVLVIEAAVLLEARWESLVDEVWVVYTAPEIARQRLMSRNGFSAKEADKRIEAQMSNEMRRASATVHICNDGSPDDLEAQFSVQWRSFLSRFQQTASISS